MDILFSCSYDNTAKVWWSEDADGDWDCVQTLGESSNGHSSTVWSLAFNAKGDKLVTCSDDLTLKIWEADIIRMQSGDGIICALSQVFMIEQSFQFTGQDEWTTFISIAIEEGEGPRQWCPGRIFLLELVFEAY
ncbi:hypothetical protein GOBAR_DD34394 [Gossypium barbadense]|nr:hypothetical protein GOBAR_DD34394 [Gossypium barbadense]